MPIDNNNYREYLLRYLEGDVTPAERNETEMYLLTHDDASAEWMRLREIKLRPDNSVVFPNKMLLLKREEDENEITVPVFKLSYRVYAAVATIAAMLLIAFLISRPGGTVTHNESAQLKNDNTEVKTHANTGSINAAASHQAQAALNQQPAENTEANKLNAVKAAVPAQAATANRNSLAAETKTPANHINPIKKNENIQIQNQNPPSPDNEPVAMAAITADVNTIANSSWAPTHIRRLRKPREENKEEVQEETPAANKDNSNVLVSLSDNTMLGNAWNTVKRTVSLKKSTVNNKKTTAVTFDAGGVHLEKVILQH